MFIFENVCIVLQLNLVINFSGEFGFMNTRIMLMNKIHTMMKCTDLLHKTSILIILCDLYISDKY